ncbi:MAG: spore photoproduct lyase family protein [Candidatus Omnitrophota bacterium]
MELHKRDLDLLNKTNSLINSRFKHVGVNKAQELTRLLYEISKKDSVSPRPILDEIGALDFNTIKKELVKKRYPYSYLNNEALDLYLPKLSFEATSVLDTNKRKFYPKSIFIEKHASGSFLAKRFKNIFPKAKVKEIPSLKEYLKQNRGLTLKDYNKRTETVFITKENYDFFKRCPCTKHAVGCGYNIFNLSFGCIFDCTYCYLQEYVNSPGLIFPSNLDNFFNKFSSYKKSGMRIGTGEFSDSLMLDNITEYSFSMIDFFNKHKDVTFEFKTKSVNIANILKAKQTGNIVISWSLNPQNIIDENEFFAPSLKERLKAIELSRKAGYKIGIHFDPVIYFSDWEKEYEKVIGLLFKKIKTRDIAWISIGTLRFNPSVKLVIEKRFPENKLLDGELLKGFDKKLRYPYGLRRSIYKKMIEMLEKHSKDIPVYLCMEDRSMWQEFKGHIKFSSCVLNQPMLT